MPTVSALSFPIRLLTYLLTSLLVGAARGAGSMKRYGVRLSVCPSMGPQQQTRAWRSVGRQEISQSNTAAAAADECGQGHVVSVRPGVYLATPLGSSNPS